MKKNNLIKKTSLLILIGLLVSTVFYPLLHEMGHIIATILIGGNVKQMTLFPVPSVLCDLTGISHNKHIMIGLSGGIFPVLVSLIYTPKHFSLWYANMLLRLISVYSLCLDYIYAILFFVGFPVANTDITDILSINRSNLFIVVVLNTAVLFLLCVSLKESALISTTLNYFNTDI